MARWFKRRLRRGGVVQSTIIVLPAGTCVAPLPRPVEPRLDIAFDIGDNDPAEVGRMAALAVAQAWRRS